MTALLILRGEAVTICLAAMCEEAKTVVVGSDRMLSSRMLSLEFEPPRPKIVKLSDSCLMMTAGPALRDIDLQKYVTRELASRAGVDINWIVEKVKEGYQEARRKKIEEYYLRPRGLTLERYLGDARSLLPEVAMQIDEHLATWDYGLEVLIAGVDSDGAHIYAVYNPGTAECFDSLGYHSIGSGESHAAFILIDSKHSHKCSLQETIWAVYQAKKNAESAPGVGQSDDFAIISPDGIIYLEKTTLDRLKELYEEEHHNWAQWTKDFQPKVASIPIPTRNKKT